MRMCFRVIVYLLVSVGFSHAISGSYEDFFAAIRQDNAKVVTDLLRRGFDPNTPDPKGLPGLVLAVREPSLSVADVLIAWPKTNVEARTPQDESALMMAALKGHLALARQLIERGADVNKPGWTPLHYASTAGHVQLIELLLENHAYIDAESPNGSTPLMMAALYGTPAAVKLLLDEGADPGIRNQLGLTAIDFARRGERKDAVELIAGAIRSARPKGRW
jgi:ankyrin repeat protein